MYEVTIAIPVFNAEKTIEATLYSALNQSFNSIEFLIINDASEDNTIEIIQSIKKNHPKGNDITIINHEINSGIGSARNTAINKAMGKYLFFLDSDDLITEKSIELLHKAIRIQNYNVAIGSHKHFNISTLEEKIYLLPNKQGCIKGELAYLRYGDLHHVLGFYVWNILYDIDFIHKNTIQFKNYRIGEDIVFLYDLLPLVESYTLIPEITYTYVKHTNSLSKHLKRNLIPKSEIDQQIDIRLYGINKIKSLKDTYYIDKMVTNQIKYFFEAASFIVINKSRIKPNVNSIKIKALLTHPLTLPEICNLKTGKLYNLLFCVWGKMPYKLIELSLIAFFYLLKTSQFIKKQIQR